MTALIKVVAIGIIATMLTIMVKQYRPELAMIISIAAGAIVLLICIDNIQLLIAQFVELEKGELIDTALVRPMIKIVGVAYICQFGAQACRDAGEKGIGDKVELCGKVAMLIICAPIIRDILEAISNIVGLG